MKVSVKNLTIGAGAYMSMVVGGYWWALSKREEAGRLSEEEDGRPKRLSEDERIAVFDKGASSYDKDISTDEVVMGLKLLRRWLIYKAQGKILEVAGGTGRNLDYFDLSKSGNELTIIDLSQSMILQTQKKLLKERKANVNFGVMDVNKMTFPAETFDTVVDTFGLCSFEDPKAALQEIQRVCRKDGKILLLEHGRSHYLWLNDILDRNSHRHTARWGCVWNRDIESIVQEAGLEITNMSRWHFGTTYLIEAKPGKRIIKSEDTKTSARGSWLWQWMTPSWFIFSGSRKPKKDEVIDKNRGSSFVQTK